jgi:enoyl-CoA hydratase/carnithine racemase
LKAFSGDATLSQERFRFVASAKRRSAMADLEIVDDAGVRLIAIHRPESKNGLTDELNGQIIAAVERSAEDRSIRTLVLTGRGGNFCSGLDLKAAAARPGGMGDAEPAMRKYFHGMIRAIRAIEKPVIALVDGAAVGYGCDLALACDLRVGTERTRLGEIFVKRGLMPDGGGTYTLPRLVGVGKALELMFTGDVIGGEEALKLGLISRLYPSERAEAETWALAKQIAKGPPKVHAWIKRAVYGALDGTLDDALEVEVKGQMQLLKSRDFMEGVSAFFEKREPNFTGE